MSEHHLQIEITKALPALLRADVRWTAIDHAAQISPRQGASRKSRGVVRGIADYLFWWPHSRAGAIEIKTKTGRVTDVQAAWAEGWMDAGHRYAVCRSLDEVRAALSVWKISREKIT